MAKKYRNLIELIVSDKNLKLAYKKTIKGKSYDYGALKFKEFLEINLKKLAEDIRNGKYKPSPSREFYVFEPKKRLISAISFRDRLVQHALCNIIEPIFDKTFLPRSFACRRGKGAHVGVKQLQAELRLMHKKGPVFFLKTDFSKYFHSIDRKILFKQISSKISCRSTLQLIKSIIPLDKIGLTIGCLTSQLFANIYGSILDRYMQQQLKVKIWYRYMDDIVVLSDSKQHLNYLKDSIQQYSFDHLKLTFSKWSISNIQRGVNFLGYRIWPTHKLLRRQSVIRAKRKITSMRNKNKIVELERFLAAWLGHASWANSYNLIKYLHARG